MNKENITVSLKKGDVVHQDDPNTITFWISNDVWVMRIEKTGEIRFNREVFPFSTPDDFARAVVGILEKTFIRVNNHG